MRIWIHERALVSVFAIAGALAFSPRISVAASWQIVAMDSAGTGRFASLKFDHDGNAHVAYVAEDSHLTLKYGFWDHILNRWFTMPVAVNAAFCSMSLDSKQRPHISYVDAGTAKGSKLRYAHWDGGTWKSEAIPLRSDVIAYYTSIALDAKDTPIISFYEYEGPGGVGFVLHLRVVSWNSGYWEERIVDATPGSGKFNSMAVDSKGKPHIAYANVKDENASLRYATWNGQSWQVEVLEGSDHTFYVYSVNVVLDKEDNPHIVYTDVANHLIKYATRQSGQWKFEAVAEIVKEGYPDRNGIALDPQGNPYISYYDAGLGTLKVAYRKNQKWTTEVVDENSGGFTSSIQLDGGKAFVIYGDEGGLALKCARILLPMNARVTGENSAALSRVSQ